MTRRRTQGGRGIRPANRRTGAVCGRERAQSVCVSALDWGVGLLCAAFVAVFGWWG